MFVETVIGWIKPFVPADTLPADAIASVSALFAFLSLGVAIAAVIYSWWAVKEARRANSIALHHFKREIYEAYQRLLTSLDKHGVHLSERDIGAFELYVNLAEVYLPRKAAAEIRFFYDKCFEVAEAHKAFTDRCDANEEARLEALENGDISAAQWWSWNPQGTDEEIATLEARSQSAADRAFEFGVHVRDKLTEHMRLVR